jgi:hypothetical protein
MLAMDPTTSCAYNDCPRAERLSEIVIETTGGPVKRRICGDHLWSVPAITVQLGGLAYRLVPHQW